VSGLHVSTYSDIRTHRQRTGFHLWPVLCSLPFLDASLLPSGGVRGITRLFYSATWRTNENCG
jgi:hypothetical protein